MPLYNPPIYNFVSGNVKGSDVAYSNLTTGQNNVALGAGTLGNLTTAINCVAIGNTALNALTTANNNIGVGYFAAGSITSGAGNIAIGTEALTNSTNGDSNTAIGFRALNSVTSGYDNISVGVFSASNITTGNNNVCLGDGSGGGITTQDNCVCAGTNSTINNATVITHATALGADSIATASNQIRLGRSAGQDTVKFTGRLEMGTPTGVDQAGALFMGAGAPNNANGNNGDIYFNSGGGALTTIYQKRVGVWVGIV